VYLAAVGTVHFQHCLPGCAQTLHIRLDAEGACRLVLGQMKVSGAIGRSVVGLQAGARPVSQPPTLGRAAVGDGEILSPKVASLCALGDLVRACTHKSRLFGKSLATANDAMRCAEMFRRFSAAVATS
jgi:hypothetical protein